MDKKTTSTLLGISSCVLWFMPWVYLDFMGVNAYQSGSHIGGLAYILLLAAVAYAILSWLLQYQLCLIVAGLSVLIAGGYLFLAGGAMGWGLVGIFFVSIASVFISYRDFKALQTARVANS
jgi:hypothetical protein